MLRVGILVSGGGTNLQAILDRMDDGHLTNVSVEVVISNNRNAYALERARNHGIRLLPFLRRSLKPERRLMRHFWQR